MLTLDHISVLNTDKYKRFNYVAHSVTGEAQKSMKNKELNTIWAPQQHQASMVLWNTAGGGDRTKQHQTQQIIDRWPSGIKGWSLSVMTATHIIYWQEKCSGPRGGGKQMELLIKSIPACSVCVEVSALLLWGPSLLCVSNWHTRTCANTKCVLLFL